MTCRAFRAACASGSRSSARCCTPAARPARRAVHRPRRSRGRRRRRRGCGALAADGAIVVAGHARSRSRRRSRHARRARSRRHGSSSDEPAAHGLRARYRALVGTARRCFWRTALLVLRKDFAIEVKSREILLHDAVLRRVVRADLRVRVREGRAARRRRRGGHSLDRDRVRRHAGARPHVRARALRRDAARAAAGAGAARRRIYVGKLLGMLAAAGGRRGCCSCRSSRSCSSAPLFARPLLLVGAARWRARSGSRRSGRSSRRCWCASRTRDVLLPILLYPITVPVIIAGVRGTAALLQAAAGRADGDDVDRHAGGVRRRVRDAGAVDVRAADDGVTDRVGHRTEN